MSDLSIEDVANRRNVSVSTVRRWIKRGLPSYKEGNIIRIPEKDEEDWINERKSKDILADKILKEILTSSKHSNIDEAGGVMATKKKGRRHFAYGSIYQRKPGGSWTIDYRNPQGKRIQQVVKTATNWQEAHEALKCAILKEFYDEHEIKRDKRKVTFRAFSEIYLKDYAQATKRSWRADKSRMKALVKHFGNIQLREITPLMIERFRASRLKSGNTKSTCNRYLALLKRMLSISVEERYLDQNPAAKIKSFSEQDTIKERMLTEEEETRLMISSSPLLQSVLTIMLNSGLRPGEVFNLRWDHISFRERILTVERTKSGKARHIPINQNLYDELIRLRNRPHKSPYLFYNPDTGHPIKSVKKAFKAACRRAGITGFRLYDCRHSFASRLIQNGCDIETIRSLLGHSDIRMTMRYAHSTNGVRRAAVELLDQKRDLACDKLVTSQVEKQTNKALTPFFTSN